MIVILSQQAEVKMSNTELNKKTKLTILFTSLAFALVFLVVGVVILAIESAPKKLEEGTSRYDKVEYGEEYVYEFTPSSSGNYEFKVNGGFLKKVKNSLGDSENFNSDYSLSSYDYSYIISLSGSNTYKFTVYSETEKELEVLVNKSTRRKLEDGVSRSDSVSYGTSYSYEFTPTSSGTYYLYINDGSLYGIREQGSYSKTYSVINSSTYDSAYSVYLYSYTSYIFTINASASSEMEVLIGSNQIVEPKTLQNGVSRSDSVSYGSSYVYEFTPYSSGTYYLYINDGYLSSAKDEEGYSLSYSSSTSSYYDRAYTIYLSSNTTCKFTINSSTYNEMEVLISSSVETGTKTLQDSVSRSDSVSYGSSYSYEFTPTSSGTYYLYMDGAYLTDVEDEYGSGKSYSNYSTSSWDKAYSIYLSSYTTYKFTVTSTSSSILIRIS